MTIKNAIQLLESFKSKTKKKSELKRMEEFMVILTALDKRKMPVEAVTKIEAYLTALELNKFPIHKRKLRDFKLFLKEEFSLLTKDYYTSLGTGLGMAFGIAIGTSLFGAGSGISLGMLFGLCFGLLVGRYMDSEAEKENRVLNKN